MAAGNAPDRNANLRSDAPKTSHGSVSGASADDERMFEDICGDLDMRIARDGTWFYHGTPIGRKPLVKLFSTILRRDANGDFWLVTPVEKGRIEVEDAPFLAVELQVQEPGPEQVLKLRTNVDDIVTVDRDHPLRVTHDPETGEPSPYVHVRDGLEARLSRPVYYELVELGEERETVRGLRYGVASSGAFFELGSLEGAAAGA